MKNQLITIALSGALALGVAGCGQQAPQTNDQPAAQEQTDQAATSVTWTDTASAQEAAAAAKLDTFGVPDSILLGDNTFQSPKFSYADGAAQANYELGAMAVFVRKANAADIAKVSDRNPSEFAATWTKNYDGIDVTMYGAARGAITLATWTDGTYAYGITYQGLGGEEMSMDSHELETLVKSIKELNAAQAPADQAAATEAGTEQTGEFPVGMEPNFTEEQCIQTACDYVGAGGQAKGPANNLVAEGPIVGGGTTYYNVDFDLGDVHYSIMVNAVDGVVVSGTQTFNGVMQLLDDNGLPLDSTEQPVE